MTTPDDPEQTAPPSTPAAEPEPGEPVAAAPAASAPPPPPERPSVPPTSNESEDDDHDDDEDEDDEDEEEEEPPRKSYGSSSTERDERSSRGPRKSGFEGLLRDSFKKAVERGLEVGLGTLKSADHVVRNVADEVKMPKEISNYLFSQIDETKNVLIKAVAGEVRTFLDSTDLASELQRALTALAFEVRMEIRFIPNEKGELKPSVKAKAVPRARRPEKRPTGRRDEDEED